MLSSSLAQIGIKDRGSISTKTFRSEIRSEAGFLRFGQKKLHDEKIPTKKEQKMVQSCFLCKHATTVVGRDEQKVESYKVEMSKKQY